MRSVDARRGGGAREHAGTSGTRTRLARPTGAARRRRGPAAAHRRAAPAACPAAGRRSRSCAALRDGIESGGRPAGRARRGARRCRATSARRSTRRCGASAATTREDEWGFDEEFAEAVYPFLEFMYERWWRVEATGVQNVPAHGRAMLVANHAGIAARGTRR